jgi:hypothetical protein
MNWVIKSNFKRWSARRLRDSIRSVNRLQSAQWTALRNMLIAERLRALMGRRSVTTPGAGLARLGVASRRLEPLLATLAASDLAEKLADQAASATQALQEARTLAAEADRNRVGRPRSGK